MRRVVVLALTAALAATWAGGQTVQAQANCDWYAKTALRQQQDNEQRKCGFTGDGWSSDLRGHLTWCLANPDKWKSEAQRREQLLASCKR
jgi:hypothetical protein